VRHKLGMHGSARARALLGCATSSSVLVAALVADQCHAQHGAHRCQDRDDNVAMAAHVNPTPISKNTVGNNVLCA
jgi:hypothetical protein